MRDKIPFLSRSFWQAPYAGMSRVCRTAATRVIKSVLALTNSAKETSEGAFVSREQRVFGLTSDITDFALPLRQPAVRVNGERWLRG
jgi:hypothetical protein